MLRKKFLNGEVVASEVFMKIPKSIKCEGNKVWKLNKAFYGLKQAARCWIELFENTRIWKDFQNVPVNIFIYIFDKKDMWKNIYAILYADGLLIVNANVDTMQRFKKYLINLMVYLKHT